MLGGLLMADVPLVPTDLCHSCGSASPLQTTVHVQATCILRDACAGPHLEGGEDLGAGGGALEASVQQRGEGPRPVVRLVHIVVLAHRVGVLQALRPFMECSVRGRGTA